MKSCHVCNADCVDDAELCPVCGAELITDNEDGQEQTAAEVVIEDPVLAASVSDVVTAEIFCDMLSENGIEHTCDEENEELGMHLMLGGSFAAINIYVSEKNLDRAQEIYTQVLESDTGYNDDFTEEYEEEPQDN